MDEKKWSRKKAAWFVGILVFLVGVPSALSNGGNEFFTEMTITMPWVIGQSADGVDIYTISSFQGILDYFFGTFFIVVVALATCVYVAWKMPIDIIIQELSNGSPSFNPGGLPSKVFVFFIRFVCPITILLVLLNMLGVFGMFAGA